MVIAIDGKWIGRSWCCRESERYHGFFLQADTSLKDPALQHLNLKQGHATSVDLIHWGRKGTMFGPAKSPSRDDSTPSGPRPGLACIRNTCPRPMRAGCRIEKVAQSVRPGADTLVERTMATATA